MKNIVIFVPLQEEMEYIYNYLTNENKAVATQEFYDENISEYNFHYKVPRRDSICLKFIVLGDMGNLVAATKLAKAVRISEIEMAILVGLGGSLDPDHCKLGDVLIAYEVKTIYPDKIKKIDNRTEVFSDVADADSGLYKIDPRKKVMSDSFFRLKRRFHRWELSSDWVSRYCNHLKAHPLENLQSVGAETELPDDFKHLENITPSVNSGTILSGDFVVDSEEFAEFLIERNKSIDMDYYSQRNSIKRDRKSEVNWFKSRVPVVDMETLGFFTAANELQNWLNPGFLFSIRGVSDVARNKSELDASTQNNVRSIAVHNAIITAIDLIEYILNHWKGR